MNRYCPRLSNDTAFAALDELNEQPDFRLSLGRLLQLLHSRLELQPRAVQQSIRPPYILNLAGGEAAALQPHRVDAVRYGRAPHRHDVGRNIASHGGAVGDEAVRA